MNQADFEAGDTASFTVQVTKEDVDAFARLSGDHNPLHTDYTYATENGFTGRVVHGMLLGAYVSRLVGMHLPGDCALLMKNMLTFKQPCYVGDQLLVRGEVVHKTNALRLLEIQVEITREKTLLATGTVHVKMRN